MIRSFIALALALGSLLAQQADFVNFEAPAVHPVRLSPSGLRLFTVDPDNHHLDVWSLADPSHPVLVTRIQVGLGPVSVTPRTDDEVWVVCWLSDSVSVVSVSEGREVATLRVKDEPSDIVFASGRAFVAATASDSIVVFDATTRMQIGTVALSAKDPRSLAVDPTGSRIYAVSCRSGNRTTVLPAAQAPPPPLPTNVGLPAAPAQGLVVLAGDPAYPQITWVIPDDDVFEISASALTVTRTAKSVGTINTNIAVHPVTGELFVVNTEARNRTRFEPQLRGHAIDSRVTRIVMSASPTVTATDLNPSVSYATLPDPSSLAVSLAEPTDIVIDAALGRLFVAAFATDRIGVTDLAGNVLARIEMGAAVGSTVNSRDKRGPRGLALHPIAQRLYVANTLSRSLSVVDTATLAILDEVPWGGIDPMPPAMRAGRKFFYDAKLSGNGTMSCASCHVDGELDGLAWDLGDPGGSMIPIPPNLATFGSPQHPMKGPMTTQTMRGLGTGIAVGDPLHWRGDRLSVTAFNVAFSALMGGSQLPPADLADFTAFVSNIAFPPNPNQLLNRNFSTLPLGASASAGKVAFQSQTFTTGGVSRTCVTCHVNPDGGAALIVPGLALGNIQAYNPPQLRNLYRRTGFNALTGSQRTGAGFSFDGTTPGLTAFLNLSFFASYPSALKDDLVAFLMAFDTGTSPIVGYRVTVDATTAGLSTTAADLSTMIARASALDADLIASTRVNGVPIDWLYNVVLGQWMPDQSAIPALSTSAFLAQALSGALSGIVTGVAWGAGHRMALDSNRDSILDGDAMPNSYSTGTLGINGIPTLIANGEAFVGNARFGVAGFRAPAAAEGYLVVGSGSAAIPILGITLLVDAFTQAPVLIPIVADSLGGFVASVPVPAMPQLIGLTAFTQAVWADPSVTFGVSSSAGLRVTVIP